MRYSPSARILAIALILLFGIALYGAATGRLEITEFLIEGLPLPLAFFVWRVVLNAAPFGDSAFHRTLPVSHAILFRQMLSLPALVAVCLGIEAAIYGAWFHFNWVAFTYLVVALPLVLWACFAFLGVAATLTTGKLGSRLLGWMASLLLLAGSATAMIWITDHYDRERPEHPLFPHWCTLCITVAFIYPLIWWLIVARRRRIIGMIFTGCTGVLLPWLMVYGDIGKFEGGMLSDDRLSFVSVSPDVDCDFEKYSRYQWERVLSDTIAPEMSFVSRRQTPGQRDILLPPSFEGYSPSQEQKLMKQWLKEWYEDPLKIDVLKGESHWLEGDGRLEFSEIEQKDSRIVASLRLYHSDLRKADGIWFPHRIFNDGQKPILIFLEDEESRQIHQLDRRFVSLDSILLGNCWSWSVELMNREDAGFSSWREHAQHWKVCIFIPRSGWVKDFPDRSFASPGGGNAVDR